MPTFTLRGRITADRRLEVQLPPDAPEGEARVTVDVEERQTPPGGNKERILAYLDELQRRTAAEPAAGSPDAIFKALEDLAMGYPGSGRTREEVDRYLREERDSWDDKE